MRLVLLLQGLWLGLLACRAPAPVGGKVVGPEPPPAGTIYRSALAAPLPAPERLLVFEKRVAAEPIWDFYGGHELRFPHAVAVPGLQDAHGHIDSLGELLETVDLTECASFEEVVDRVAARAAETPADQWVVGRGWDQTRWPGQAFPHHADLSARVPGHPVYLKRVDGHAALVNARALALAGIAGRELPTIPGGRILTGDDGRATGVLVDQATELVFRRIPEPDAATRERRVLAAQERLLSQGLTCVHDMGTEPGTLDALLRLEADGRLKLRVLCYLSTRNGLDPAWLARIGRPEDYGPERKVRVVGAKTYLDGALGSRGAALLAPYSDEPDERGLLQATHADFAALLRQVVAAGLQPATHAIGDAANRLCLDAYGTELQRDGAFARLRPRIEHAQVVALDDLERFARLGVIPSMQPTHATSDMRWAEARLGPQRVQGSYAWKRLGSARLALGSDFPVESSNPLLGLYAARTRQDVKGMPAGGWRPDQCLSAAEALDGFTGGAAFAAREDGQRGTLDPGCFCDVTVLDVDPLTCAPSELLTARVLATIIDGEVVYENPDRGGKHVSRLEH